ncbi:transglycosylase family protein [Streptomyces nodosus]|uniref:LysM peptidoglycan-binding domain-containing protein n=1 Tax=Streptomyces nodosus TaxID=40318 RepID=UPI0036ED49D8
MLSGNGRHRRPRQAPAVLVAAGVTGSAIAIPLLGATGASAATGATWDQVAQCESGGAWSADTGNGRYGGLQMTQGDWEAHGGLDYASSPDRASRSQQIAVAEKILDERGASAWASCGLVSGLEQDSGSAGVDTGLARDASGAPSSGSGVVGFGLSESPDRVTPVTPAPSSSPSSEATADSEGSDAGASASQESTAPSDQKSGSADEGDKSGKSQGQGTPSSEAADDASGGGRHRGGSAEETAVDGRDDDTTGRHASRSSDTARDAGTDAEAGTYIVRAGDSLAGIAHSLGVKGGWSALYDGNKQTVGTDPDLIVPGQNLAVDDGQSADQR